MNHENRDYKNRPIVKEHNELYICTILLRVMGDVMGEDLLNISICKLSCDIASA